LQSIPPPKIVAALYRICSRCDQQAASVIVRVPLVLLWRLNVTVPIALEVHKRSGWKATPWLSPFREHLWSGARRRNRG
jgi:hypothetical protein